MSVGYILVNQTKREKFLYTGIPAGNRREFAGCPVSAAITTWYLLEHAGDSIAFVSDTYGEWPFKTGSLSDLSSYSEVTEGVVAALVQAEILRDEGREIFDESEPEIYIHRLRNVWWPESAS